jgi:hypothetical protein
MLKVTLNTINQNNHTHFTRNLIPFNYLFKENISEEKVTYSTLVWDAGYNVWIGTGWVF